MPVELFAGFSAGSKELPLHETFRNLRLGCVPAYPPNGEECLVRNLNAPLALANNLKRAIFEEFLLVSTSCKAQLPKYVEISQEALLAAAVVQGKSLGLFKYFFPVFPLLNFSVMSVRPRMTQDHCGLWMNT